MQKYLLFYRIRAGIFFGMVFIITFKQRFLISVFLLRRTDSMAFGAVVGAGSISADKPYGKQKQDKNHTQNDQIAYIHTDPLSGR